MLRNEKEEKRGEKRRRDEKRGEKRRIEEKKSLVRLTTIEEREKVI